MRVTIAWYQHRVLIAINNQRFQHQFTLIHQLIFQLPEMLQRRTAMVKHAHRKDGIKGFQCRKLFNT
ncbi:Uncharacterised protein [Shigella sonnei]|nr:Uncharacterised protein [Shigella sonnei]